MKPTQALRLAAICLALPLGAPQAHAQATSGKRAVGERPTEYDERLLWDWSAEAERAVRVSAEINKDPALNAYVREVGCKVAAEYCGDIRFYVMDRPFFNAQMTPNGYGEVWSGLLLRVSNEAELAFVLGHEVSHFAENHSLAAYRQQKERQRAAVLLTIGAAAFGSIGMNLFYMSEMASAFNFSREQEEDADARGLARLNAAGYDPAAGFKIWRSLLDETAASDFEKVRREPTRSSVFNSHPLGPDRLAALEVASRAMSGVAEQGLDRYRAAIRPHLAGWLRDDLRRRDFGQTLYIVSHLASQGQDLGLLSYFRGEVYRLRAKEGDLALAADAYADAVNRIDAPVEAWRELGEARRKQRNISAAQIAFETYLSKAPDAEDAWLVADTLKSLQRTP